MSPAARPSCRPRTGRTRSRCTMPCGPSPPNTGTRTISSRSARRAPRSTRCSRRSTIPASRSAPASKASSASTGWSRPSGVRGFSTGSTDSHDRFRKRLYNARDYSGRGGALPKYVYLFEEGDASMRDLLGGKGAGLAEMTRLGLPVPPGFTITTKACNAYSKSGRFPPGLWKQVTEGLAAVETKSGKKFGDAEDPLLVSVRSGAKFSMPGMMDTILNLGLNDSTVAALGRLTSNDRFAWDAYRRLIGMYGRIVREIDGRKFEAVLERFKGTTGSKSDTDLDADALRAVVEEFKGLYRREAGEAFPDDPRVQLREAIGAVFRSWNGKRAVDYRNFNKIPHDLGTAATVQTMVFGNMGPDSGTGVAFTRNPSTGERELFGEFLPDAQGEDVVAG